MNREVKNKGTVLTRLVLTAALAFVMAAFSSNSKAAAMTEDQTGDIISSSVKLLFSGKEPTAEQRQKIQSLKEMIDKGELSKQQIRQMANDSIYESMEKDRLSRYEIGNMLNRTPELLPSVSGKNVHRILWDKVVDMLDEPLILKTATLAPKGTPWIIFPEEKLDVHINKISKGKIISKVYPGGVMGEDIDILRKIEMGQLDGCGCTALGLFKATPELTVLSLPRLFRNYEEVDHIVRTFRKEIDAIAREKGYEIDFMVDSGFFYLWVKNKVTNLEELRKQKVLIWMGLVEATVFKNLGISPIPVAVPEIVASLNTGLINTHVSPSPWVMGTQAYLQDNYYVAQPLYYAPGVQLYSRKNIIDRLKGKNSENLINNFMELRIYEIRTLEREYIDENLRPYEKKCLEAFEKKGIKPITFSDEDMAVINKASKKAWEELSGQVYSKAFLDKILNELERFRNK